MEIKISNVEINSRALEPTLTVQAAIEYYRDLEVPLYISGKLLTPDGKIVAYLHEHQISREVKLDLSLLKKDAKEDIYKSGNKYQGSYWATLTLPLSQKAIEHIEAEREKNNEKSVVLCFDFILKWMELPIEATMLGAIQHYNLSFATIVCKHINSSFTIKQSDWVKKYSPALGIGNFVLLEYAIPDKHEVSKDWSQLYERSYLRMQEMESAIRQGDWQRAMFAGRQFFENLKIGDKKPNHKNFEDQLRELFKNDKHDDEGFDEFLNGIKSFFNFTSKYIHDKDRHAQLKAVPVPTKEDAYFIFSLSIGLLNIIGKKINKS